MPGNNNENNLDTNKEDDQNLNIFDTDGEVFVDTTFDAKYSSNLKPATAINYIDRYAVKLNMPKEYKIKCIKVSKIAETKIAMIITRAW